MAKVASRRVLEDARRWRRASMAVAVAAGLAVLATPSAPAGAAGLPTVRTADLVVSESDGTASVLVRLSEPAASTVTVAYATTTYPYDLATAGDFTATSGTATFPAGSTTQTIPVSLVDDLQVEPMQSFHIRLSSPSGATLTGGDARVSIVDDDTESASPEVIVRDAIVDEQDGTVDIPVLLGGATGVASASSVSVAFTTTGGSATSGADYTATSGTLVFAPGDTVEHVVVPIAADGATETAEQFTVDLSAPSGATIADGTGRVTIGMSGPASGTPRASVPDVLVGENDGYVDIPITLSSPPATAQAVAIWVDDAGSGGATYADLVRVDTSVTFRPLQTTATVRVEVVDDVSPEILESARIHIAGIDDLAVARADAHLSIIDDDTVVASPGVFAKDAVVDEKAGTVDVPVLLGGGVGQASAGTVTVGFTTTSSTATAGSDFATTSGTLVFSPGETIEHVVVPITADALAEGDERFTVDLSGAAGGSIAHGSGVVTIVHNGPPAASTWISAPDLVVGESDGYVDVPITLSAPVAGVVSVEVSPHASTNGSGTSDYRADRTTVTFAPGETLQRYRFDLREDAVAESVESVDLWLEKPSGAPVTTTVAKVSIVDNDTVVATPQVSARDAVVDEAAGTATVQVLLGGAAGQASASPITVSYATADGTATAGSDYTAASGSLSFGPGETVARIVVPITADAVAEATERFSVTLTSPSGATLGDPTGVIVIGAKAAPVVQPTVSMPDGVMAEGEGWFDLPLALSAPTSTPVKVTTLIDYNAAATTASAGSEITYLSLDLTFAPGQTTRTVRFEVLPDQVFEAPEGFVVKYFVTGATLSRPTSTVTIVDDDGGIPTFGLGRGDDAYTVATTATRIVENPDGGTDPVTSSVTYTLPINLETLTLTGSAAINGTGNAGNNTITGNSGANALAGSYGNDTLLGGGGKDALTGSAGTDTLTGGTNTDTYVFNSLSGSDTVTDFNHTDDTLRFSKAGIAVGDGDTVVEGATTRTAPGGFSKSAEVVIFTSNISGTITTTTAAAKIGSATSAYATGNVRLFVVDNGTRSAVYRFRSSAANASVSASELTLVAVLVHASGTTGTTTTDITFAA